MRNHLLPYLTGLQYLFTSALAAPPLNVLSPASLGAASATASHTKTTSLSASSTFPPFPPPGTLLYHIPDSPIILRFRTLNYIPDRSETDVQKVLEEVIMDSVGYIDRKAVIPPHEHNWECRDIVLWLEPEREDRSHGVALTWALWTMTLRGVRDYIRAYPGVFFSYEIYVGQSEVMERRLVGFGALTRYIGP